MKVEVSSQGVYLNFKLIEGNLVNFNRLKFQMGAENVQNNPFDSKQFSIDHLIYFGIEAKINQIIKEKKIIPSESFKSFYLSIARQSIKTEREIGPDELKQELKSQKFSRELRPFQLTNVIKLISRNFGATFSVPGAGKTTEILGAFSYFKSSTPDLKLFIICPKNAFSAWDEQIAECFSNSKEINQGVVSRSGLSFSEKMVRLGGGIDNIANLLDQVPDTIMITFQQLAYSRDIVELIASFISEYNVFCAVDESHRIKGVDRRGVPGKYASSALSLAPLCKYRYIMSGTPMPQGNLDLINQYKFIFPRANEFILINQYKFIINSFSRGQMFLFKRFMTKSKSYM